MLSTQYRLRLESICDKIAKGKEVSLEDMIWSEKLAKANRSAATMLRQARRKVINPDMAEGGMDDFLNCLDIGDPDPSNYKTGFGSVDEIVDWFKRDDDEGWRQRD